MKKNLYQVAQKNRLFSNFKLLSDEKIMNILAFNINFLKKIILEQSMDLLNSNSDEESDQALNLEYTDSCEENCCEDDHGDKEENGDSQDTQDSCNDSCVDEDVLREYTTMLLINRIARLFEHIVTVSIINKYPEFPNINDFGACVEFLEKKNIITDEEKMSIGMICMFAEEISHLFLFHSMDGEDDTMTMLTNDEQKLSNVPISLWYEPINQIEALAKKLYQ